MRTNTTVLDIYQGGHRNDVEFSVSFFAWLHGMFALPLSHASLNVFVISVHTGHRLTIWQSHNGKGFP